MVYHGCGDVSPIFEDFIEVGTDACNPLEAKTGLDVVDLRREYGHRNAFCGNMDARDWDAANFEELEAIILRKLNAGKGDLILQSDHSIPSNISTERYEFVPNLVREHGQYPLKLGEHGAPESDAQ